MKEIENKGTSTMRISGAHTLEYKRREEMIGDRWKQVRQIRRTGQWRKCMWGMILLCVYIKSTMKADKKNSVLFIV